MRRLGRMGLMLGLLVAVAMAVDIRYSDQIAPHSYSARVWTQGVSFPADSNRPSMGQVRRWHDSMPAGMDSSLLATGWGLILSWAEGVGTFKVDSHAVHLWGDQFWSGGSGTDQQARDTAGYAKALATRDSLGNLRDSTRIDSKLDTAGTAKNATNATNATHATGADSAALADSAVNIPDSITFVKGGGTTCIITGANAWAAGLSDTASGATATVGGGTANKASGAQATVAGGNTNKATGTGSSIIGGSSNSVSSAGSIAGGISNTVTGSTASIAAGYGNTSSADYATTFGSTGTNDGDYSTISGGYLNRVSSSSDGATVSGGMRNRAAGYYATVCGGLRDSALVQWATIGGGELNTAAGLAAIIPGGYKNRVSANYGVALGNHDTVPVADTGAVVAGYCQSSNGIRSVTVRGTGGTWVSQIFGKETTMVRTAGAAFAASRIYGAYADSCAGVDTINLAACSAGGAEVLAYTLRDSVFITNGAAAVTTLTAAGKYARLKYFTLITRWLVVGSN